jgi:hypothetical protein
MNPDPMLGAETKTSVPPPLWLVANLVTGPRADAALDATLNRVQPSRSIGLRQCRTGGWRISR